MYVNKNATIGGAVSLLALACVSPALGQSADADARRSERKPTVSTAKPPSPNATVNLLNLFVQKGLITQDEAGTLIKQAEDEAYVARQAAKEATAKADDATRAATAATAAAPQPGTRHVTYVPEIVKQQLRDEIKHEVFAKAEKENWASPGAYPEWASRIHLYGDIQAQYWGTFFPGSNPSGFQAGAFNFNAINRGPPLNVGTLGQGVTAPPVFDLTQDRNQPVLSGRFGLEANLTNGFSTGVRLATGNTNSPVSTNQTLGATGGDFSKYNIWLDRGYIAWSGFDDDLKLSVGRSDSPFFSPTNLVWANGIGFDGVTVQAKHEVLPGFTPFVALGAAPVFNTAFNLNSSNFNINDPVAEDSALPSHDSYLFGGQFGVATKVTPDIDIRFAAAFYDYVNVRGQASDLNCETGPAVTAATTCNTDDTRTPFSQQGNTMVELRNIPPTTDPNNPIPNLQYFGLASDFRPAVASTSVDIGVFNPYHVIVDGEFVINTAFNKNALTQAALLGNGIGGAVVNNFGANSNVFDGGNMGWQGQVTFGNKEIKHLWDWNAYAGYRYLQSDAVIDAFTDYQFGLGGTNLQGYYVGARLGLADDVWASVKWMSANSIAGTPYGVDVLLVDINARF